MRDAWARDRRRASLRGAVLRQILVKQGGLGGWAAPGAELPHSDDTNAWTLDEGEHIAGAYAVVRLVDDAAVQADLAPGAGARRH